MPDHTTTTDEEMHPAAENADQLAWAVWIEEDGTQECYAVTGDSKAKAREKAIARHDGDGGRVHVDGPFENSDPGVWEFEYVTEHRETVVVEAPSEEYAAETAQTDRTYKGEFIQTVRTNSRRVEANPSQEEDNDA